MCKIIILMKRRGVLVSRSLQEIDRGEFKENIIITSKMLNVIIHLDRAKALLYLASNVKFQ